MSNDRTEDRPDGPVEAYPFPSKLRAHVVSTGPAPRIHGYDVHADLALNYSCAEQAFLALTGDLPADDETSRAIEVALSFLSPSPIASAPTHAAALAHLSGATTSATIATAALALAEQARSLVHTHAAASGAPTQDSKEAIGRLQQALPARFASHAASAPTVEAAALSVLQACGLSGDALEAMIVWCRLPSAVAEALAVRPGSFREYPMDLPAFRYEAPRE